MTLRLSDVPTDEQIEAAANERIDRRRTTGQKLAMIARKLQEAQNEVTRLASEYEKAYKDATTDAWTPKELTANGLPAPLGPRRRNKDSSRAKASRPAKPESTTH